MIDIHSLLVITHSFCILSKWLKSYIENRIKIDYVRIVQYKCVIIFFNLKIDTFVR